MDAVGVVTIAGEGRELAAESASNRPLRVELAGERLTLTLDGAPPLAAAYRDVTTIAVQHGQVLLVLGADVRFIVERLGDRLGTLVSELRERRARQLLADRLIALPRSEALELCEYRVGEEHGVAQLAFHAWGAALLPLDERRPQRLVRRADIEVVEARPSEGLLHVAAKHAEFELLGLGAAVEKQRQRWAGLRASALADAATIIEALLPDASLDLRRRAASLLVDGQPVERSQLGVGWQPLESAVLSEALFAASYAALAQRGQGSRWIAIAPQRPSVEGEPAADATPHVAWFFVALPARLVAMEIVSAGAHATYLFRGDDAGRVVSDVSEALIDARFLRAPLYLSEEQLRDARHLRSRLAIAALPSLRAARSRFVGRVIHRDDESWAAALDDAIAWSSATPGNGQRWPGSAADDEAAEDEPAAAQADHAVTDSQPADEEP